MSERIAPSAVVVTLGPTVAAGTNEDWVLYRAVTHGQVLGAYFSNGANLTGHATNYTTVSVRKGSTTVASRAFTAGNDATADVPVELELASSSADRKFAPGDVLTFRKADSGTGMAITAQASVILFLLVGAQES